MNKIFAPPGEPAPLLYKVHLTAYSRTVTDYFLLQDNDSLEEFIAFALRSTEKEQPTFQLHGYTSYEQIQEQEFDPDQFYLYRVNYCFENVNKNSVVTHFHAYTNTADKIIDHLFGRYPEFKEVISVSFFRRIGSHALSKPFQPNNMNFKYEFYKPAERCRLIRSELLALEKNYQLSLPTGSYLPFSGKIENAIHDLARVNPTFDSDNSANDYLIKISDLLQLIQTERATTTKKIHPIVDDILQSINKKTF